MFAAALYHAAAIAFPAWGVQAYSATYPLWRHIVFIVNNTVMGAILLHRPMWLLWPYSLLTVQIYYSHGGTFLQRLHDAGRVGWIDLLSVAGATLGVTMLHLEARRRTRARTRSVSIAAATSRQSV